MYRNILDSTQDFDSYLSSRLHQASVAKSKHTKLRDIERSRREKNRHEGNKYVSLTRDSNQTRRNTKTWDGNTSDSTLFEHKWRMHLDPNRRNSASIDAPFCAEDFSNDTTHDSARVVCLNESEEIHACFQKWLIRTRDHLQYHDDLTKRTQMLHKISRIKLCFKAWKISFNVIYLSQVFFHCLHHHLGTV